MSDEEIQSVALDSLGEWRAACGCGTLRTEQIGEELILIGWVDVRRDHGGIVFIDLRDRTGVVQLVLDPDDSPDAHRRGHQLRHEYVVAARGKIARRPEETLNPALPTGEVELRVELRSS